MPYTYTCVECGKNFSRPQRPTSSTPCCSRVCMASRYRRLTGPDSRAWRGGRSTVRAGQYVTVWTPTGRILEHRHVMEQSLGRKLSSHEVVHHINGNRTDNKLENLQLCESQSAHISNHHDDKPTTNNRICDICGAFAGARNLCNKHYKKAQRDGTLYLAPRHRSWKGHQRSPLRLLRADDEH